MKKTSKGFTIVEVLVVISVIMILVLLTSYANQNVKENALKVQCINSLRQISLAIHMYANDNRGFFPNKGNWGVAIYPKYLQSAENLDCPAHAYVGVPAGPDYWYEHAPFGVWLTTESKDQQTLIAGCYDGCHYGFENKLTIGGNIIFQTPGP